MNEELIPGAKHEEHPVVCVKQASFSYDRLETDVLSEIDFCLNEGLFLGIIGPNGGGKTTLLKLILGILEPGQGQVEIFGLPPRDSRVRRDLVGYVPQAQPIHQNFPATVTDVIEMGAYGKVGMLKRLSPELKERAKAE